MTTPNGNPTGANPARPRGYSSGDADVQANPMGGGQFTGGGEATVIGSNMDMSNTGSGDATGAATVQRSGIANKQGNTPFTAED